MSRFKTAPVDTDNVGSWVERRRKGRMIRKQHTVTGKWSPWLLDYSRPKFTDAPSERALAHSVLKDMTVADLRDLAKGRGVKVPSKARKADIISALTEPR
jgi:hypothetical protein